MSDENKPGATYAPGTQAAGPPPAAITKTLDEYTQDLHTRRDRYGQMGGEEAMEQGVWRGPVNLPNHRVLSWTAPAGPPA